ncbi:hypothetical protein RHMOL_Rhmol04G0203300 [Rhododendron molle]|uniref:Uncharacterized protein n=1 Tax=Rhododendron molle TaxID=49168 RepID=A0ACC0P2E0_RHOML|nr:hypothetical protein RHMOL_Rhmol04G0203300 [Rhododendron molle]
MMRRHARFEPAQIVVPINRPKIPTPPIVWETINLIQEAEEFQMQPWVNPYEESDYSQWVKEEEDLNFIYIDPYGTRECNFDEIEGEYDDPLDEISLASLFNQVEIADLPHDYTIIKEEKEVMKTQANTSILGLFMSQRGSHHASFEDGPSSKALFGKEDGGKEYKVAKAKIKEDDPEMLQ